MEEIPFGSPELPHERGGSSTETAEEVKTREARPEAYSELFNEFDPGIHVTREADAQLNHLHDSGREQFIEHTPRVRRNKGREAKRRRRQALRKVRGYIQVREAGVPDTHEPVIRCRDCNRLADPTRAAKIGEPMCECPDMDETLENSANNGTNQNPDSLVLARVSRATLDARVAYRAAQAAEEKAQADAKYEILAERARLRAQRAE